MLFTKCILHKAVPEDGIRISVMSRHTLNDGITPDHRIQKYHLHIPQLGPSPKLIGTYYKTNMCWLDFSQGYRNQMNTFWKRIFIKLLAWLSAVTDVTLLCIEDKADCCHRRLLAEECKKQQPALTVTHR